MKVAVIGAGGQLGAAIVREFDDAGAHVLALTRRHLDVTREDAAAALVSLRPEVVVNCSAWNDVDGAEANPEGAFAVNARAVERLACAAEAVGAVLVHYSTDFVFDGCAEEPYEEDTPPAPLNTYGASKLAGERAAARVERHYVMRLSSVFGGRPGEGAAGRVTLDRMIHALGAGREVRAFYNRTVTPSYTVDVARATRALVMRGASGGVYHCVNSGATTWYELARYLAETIGTSAPVVAVCAEMATPAKRPRMCALSNGRLQAAGVLMPTWRHAVRRHLARHYPLEDAAASFRWSRKGPVASFVRCA